MSLSSFVWIMVSSKRTKEEQQEPAIRGEENVGGQSEQKGNHQDPGGYQEIIDLKSHGIPPFFLISIP